MDDNTQTLESVVADLGLTISAVFVAWSDSRNAKADPTPRDYCLNWWVSLIGKVGTDHGRVILTTDYQAGHGHIPRRKAAQWPDRWSMDNFKALQRICETGRSNISLIPRGSNLFKTWKGVIQPKALGVIHSLVMDADAVGYAGFEDWAENCGFDTDSRKAETIYNQCLDHALKLRNALGNDDFERLQAAASEY